MEPDLTASPMADPIPLIQISESPGPTGDYALKKRKKREVRSKSISYLHADDSASEGGTSDDGRLVSRKLLRKTNVKKESFDDFIRRRRNVLEKERSTISLYTSPVLVVTYFVAYISYQIKMGVTYAQSRKWILISIPAALITLQVALLVEGPHKKVIYATQSCILWYLYWIALGIASSVGLGTGLHTFVLFLGPHIAEVTWVAFECGNLDFETRGPDRFRCQATTAASTSVSLWSIFCKVFFESFFWGFGTALGELPPYFIARAAALSGSRSQELATIDALMTQAPDQISFKEKTLVHVHRIMQRLGFWGILLFASIPNPLFDLAGIICGQFLVPFSTFFGATFLGKAVIKSSIQTTVVILVFSRDTLASILQVTKYNWPYLHNKLEKLVEEQTNILRRGEGVSAPDDALVNPGYLSIIWSFIFNGMLLYFVLSVIETLAIAHLKRLHDKELEELERKAQKQQDEQNLLTPEAQTLMTMSLEVERKLEKGHCRGYSSD